MSFKDLNISLQYSSTIETNNLLKDFYIPVLSQTYVYKRAVGYFSSNSLVIAAQGISSLIDRGGKMQLIASPYLEKEDIEAIMEGYKRREEVIETALVNSLKNPENIIYEERLNFLAWLISNNQLDIKIAVLKSKKRFGIYHEKVGIMEDIEGNIIAFSGSSNETEGGLLNNYESIDVFCSWKKEDYERVKKKYNDFQKLWNNTAESLEIIEFPKAAKEKLLTYKKNKYYKFDPGLSYVKETNNSHHDLNKYPFPKIPNYIRLRDYQREAIQNWFQNKCQGLLEMATGTGKTITALSAISKLWELTKRLGVVIVCPYTHLVNQWVIEIKDFNMQPIIAYSGKNWEDRLYNEIISFNSRIINHFCLVTTMDTFVLERMQKILSKIENDVVFIADEAHHLGAKKRRNKLLQNIPYRLALSATPYRWHDEVGTTELLNYFGGKVVFEFGLNQAIGEYLTEYFYYPHIVYLDDDESEEYYEITKQISKLYVLKDENLSIEYSDKLKHLLIKRARILSKARNKLILLRKLFLENTDSNYNIVYCGDSNVDGEKQIKKVINILGNELNMRVHSFTAEEKPLERRELLDRFSSGELQVLVAIKCLDEGVDIPATQNAYILASSTNPREFIQRRGRILRKHKNKKYSYIHDFIVIPRKINEIKMVDSTIFNIDRKLVKRELQRFIEFANLAINGPQAHESIQNIKKAYNLMDL